MEDRLGPERLAGFPCQNCAQPRVYFINSDVEPFEVQGIWIGDIAGASDFDAQMAVCIDCAAYHMLCPECPDATLCRFLGIFGWRQDEEDDDDEEFYGGTQQLFAIPFPDIHLVGPDGGFSHTWKCPKCDETWYATDK